MGKQLNLNNLSGRRISRALLAVSLTASLAATGCTTNRTPGNGEPVRDGFVRTAPTGGITSGSEIPLPPPMTSSYTGTEPMPPVSARRSAYVGADQAAAIMAAQQPRVRVLGPANPGSAVAQPLNEMSTTAQRNAAITYEPPRITVNSSINSSPAPAVSNEALAMAAAEENEFIAAVAPDGTVITPTGGVTSNATVGGTTGTANSTTVAGTTAGTSANSTFATAPTATVAPALTPGVVAGTATATPTATSGAISTVTAGTSPTLTTTPLGATTTGTRAITPTVTTTSAGTRMTARRNGTTTGAARNARVTGTTSGAAAINGIRTTTTQSTSGTVRAIRSLGGGITITNNNNQ
jgi:hypothetical protein